MELNKKKYKRDEVEDIVNNLKIENQSVITSLKQKINELVLENKKLNAEIDDYREKENTISSAIKDAESFSDTLKDNAMSRYLNEIQSLKAFSERWREYFNLLKEKYPLYGKVDQSKKVFDEISTIISRNSGKKAVGKIDSVLDGAGVPKNQAVFNPQQKIDDYISATSDTGFDLNEVLNPGELELGELCKELGLIEEL